MLAFIRATDGSLLSPTARIVLIAILATAAVGAAVGIGVYFGIAGIIYFFLIYNSLCYNEIIIFICFFLNLGAATTSTTTGKITK